MVQRTEKNWIKGYAIGLLGGVTLLAMSSQAPAAHRGSGFLINNLGHILTNNHVVMDQVRTPNGYWFRFECQDLTVKSRGFEGRVKIVARDEHNDLAVVQLENPTSQKLEVRQRQAEAFTPVATESWRNLADQLRSGNPGSTPSTSVKMHHYIRFAAKPAQPGIKMNLLGFPLGLGISSQLKISAGIVSATMGFGNNSSALQYDAASNPGNSGGPALDESGNLIGVHYAGLKVIPGGWLGITVAEGINFAIKSNVAENFLKLHGVPFERANSSAKRSSEEIYKSSLNAVALVTCL